MLAIQDPTKRVAPLEATVEELKKLFLGRLVFPLWMKDSDSSWSGAWFSLVQHCQGKGERSIRAHRAHQKGPPMG
eukprot:342785-Pelagomonas_calceolata.AAC.5